MVTTFLFDRSLRESSSSKTSDLVVASVKDHRPVIGVRESLQSYLIKKRKHVSQHVWNWHIEELGKVVQAQLLSLQLPGSVPVLLQNLLSVLGFQPGTATRGDFMLMNNLAEVSTRTFGKDNQKKTERIFFFTIDCWAALYWHVCSTFCNLFSFFPHVFNPKPPLIFPSLCSLSDPPHCQILEGVDAPPPIYMGLPILPVPERTFTKKPYRVWRSHYPPSRSPPVQAPEWESLAQQQGHIPQLESSSISWNAHQSRRCHCQKMNPGSLWCLLSVFPLVSPLCPFLGSLNDGSIALEGSSDLPQSPDELGILQQTGVDWQSELAFCHGQLAVFKWIVCDGYPQGSRQSTEETGHQYKQINTNSAEGFEGQCSSQ